MSTFYSRDEIISTSQAQKVLKMLLDSLQSGEREKVAISRNNKIDAVLISSDRYEALEELAEHLEIAKIVEARKKDETFDFDELLKNGEI